MPLHSEVRLNSGEPIGPLHYFRPGEVVAGTVEVAAPSPSACRSLSLRLIWFTEGECEENVGVVAAQMLAEGSLPVGQPVRSGFAFQLPPEPWTYNGTLVNIVWAIEVWLDLPFQPDEVHRTRFMVRPFWAI